VSASPRLAEGDVTLHELLRRAAAAARHRPLLATYVEPLEGIQPLDAFERADAAGDRIYWARPSTGVAVAGIGAAATIAPSGEGRFAAAARLWQALLSEAICDGPAAVGAEHDFDGDAFRDAPANAFGRRPMLLGGFRFDPARRPVPEWLGFPDSWLMVPRICLVTSPNGRWLSTSALVKPGDDPARLADALERERERLLGGGRAAENRTAWAKLVASMRGPGTARNGNGAHANGGHANGGHANGGHANGGHANGAHANGGHANGAHAKDGAHDAPEHESSPRDSFMRAVAEGAAAVREGTLEKVVAARAVAWQPREAPDAGTALRRLEERHPECNVFAVARGRRVFLGASPERLVRVDGRTVHATSLAGSIARGNSPDEDARRAAELMASAKNREEHEIVVRALTTTLAELCDAVSAPATPTLLTLPDVHHLYTPITARRREGTDLFRLLERLHPTPAVGGAPREEALAFIREHEGWDRGWYAAPVGWMDASGDGEFAVALRSALMDGRRATLFAGCGIVADSMPSAEYEESELKLRAMRNALEGGTHSGDSQAEDALTGDALVGDASAGDAHDGVETRES
jgi:isochorismate synthase